MPNFVQDSPAKIAAQLFADMGETWPVFVDNEPDSPDNCITITDTAGYGKGRTMIDGEPQGLYGMQVRVRAKDHPTGWAKADELQNRMATQVYRRTVVVGANTYLLWAFSRIGDVLRTGIEMPTSVRRVFTINVFCSVNQL